MEAEDVIESYVRDAAARLPRANRGDVAFELRALIKRTTPPLRSRFSRAERSEETDANRASAV